MSAILTPRKKAKLIAAMAKGITLYEAARLMAVSIRTMYRWREIDPDLRDRMDEAKEMADDEIEATVFEMAKDRDPANNTLRIFWLKNRRKDEFGAESGVTVNGTVQKLYTNGSGTTPEDL